MEKYDPIPVIYRIETDDTGDGDWQYRTERDDLEDAYDVCGYLCKVYDTRIVKVEQSVVLFVRQQ